MHQEDTGPAKGSLYVVATPIGNLRDITLRALDVLSKVDVVAAEDTRTTGHLLAHHAISTRLMALHEHNERIATQKVIALLESGKSVALVSDAGTPGISDPGAFLVSRVRERGFPVIPVPGANAALCAISAAGEVLPHFLFYGFLPSKASVRRRVLQSLKSLPYLLVFYEAPHRVLECIADMEAILGAGRRITIARELTKVFETIHVCTLAEAPAWLAEDANRRRGEFVLLVAGAEAREAEAVSEEARRVLLLLLDDLPLKQAVALTADISGESRNKLYDLALKLRQAK